MGHTGFVKVTWPDPRLSCEEKQWCVFSLTNYFCKCSILTEIPFLTMTLPLWRHKEHRYHSCVLMSLPVRCCLLVSVSWKLQNDVRLLFPLQSQWGIGFCSVWCIVSEWAEEQTNKSPYLTCRWQEAVMTVAWRGPAFCLHRKYKKLAWKRLRQNLPRLHFSVLDDFLCFSHAIRALIRMWQNLIQGHLSRLKRDDISRTTGSDPSNCELSRLQFVTCGGQ